MRERRDERSAKVIGWAQTSPLRVNATFGLVKPDTARLPYSNLCGQILETLKENTTELRKLQIWNLTIQLDSKHQICVTQVKPHARLSLSGYGMDVHEAVPAPCSA